jgi:hypothetical protein
VFRRLWTTASQRLADLLEEAGTDFAEGRAVWNYDTHSWWRLVGDHPQLAPWSHEVKPYEEEGKEEVEETTDEPS